jgi:hypothetical protein
MALNWVGIWKNRLLGCIANVKREFMVSLNNKKSAWLFNQKG